MEGMKIPIDLNISHETPKYWKEYLQYVSETNRKSDDDLQKILADRQAERDKLSKWQKILSYGYIDWEELQIIAHWPDPIKPSITGYYTWDVNVRQAK